MDFIQNFISEELIYALGWTVMHSIWQGFLIAIVMALALQVWSKKSAKVRYEVATFSLFLVLACSVCTFIWHFGSAGEMLEQELTIVSQTSGIDQAVEGTLLQGFSQSCIDYFNTHLPMIVLIWLAGVCFFILRLFGGLAYVQRLKYHRVTLMSPYWQDKVQALASRIPTKKTAQIFESAYVKVPMVIGYFKPYILMPLGAINQLDESEVEAIIAHELAHIFRKDFVLNIFISFIEVFFYYHPAVWWISGNIRLERENCCDDIAIRVCGNSLTYAKALVRVQELNSYAPGFAMPFSGQKNQLLNRIKRILNQPQNRSNIMEKLTATCFLMIAIIFMSVSANNADNTFEVLETPTTKISETHTFVETDFENDKRVIVVVDTIPEVKKKIREAQSIEITQKDGEITELIIDGEEIPEEEYEEYEDVISDKIIIKQNRVTPDSPSWLDKSSPRVLADNARILYESALKKTKKQQTITKETNENGQTVIVVESDGIEPVEIVVDEVEDVIIVDGNELEDGDTAVIIDESRSGAHFRDRLHFFGNDDRIQFREADTVLWNGNDLNNELFKYRFDENGENDFWVYRDNALAYPEIRKKMEALRKENGLKSKKQQQELMELLSKAEMEQRSLFKGQLRKSDAAHDELLKANKLKLQRARDLYHEQMLFLKDDHLNRSFLRSDQYTNNVAQKIARELKKDGLIKDTRDFSFLLSNKKLKVNGKKQPAYVFKKYQELYERLTGSELNGKSKYQINFQHEEKR